jgi:hypothetical protein
MSNALAIAGVSAVLRDLLNDGLINHNVAGVIGSSVNVSVGPPDRVIPADGNEASQLNLFLYQVTPNPGWRNHDLPSRDSSGRQRLSNPPLALNLHYLLSAHSAVDLHGEILFGYAMQLLHETPTLTREAIRTALNPSPDVGATLPPALRALAESGLADQIEHIRVTPEYLGTEEMSKLWTAVQSHYRPTAAYQASVVLIESRRLARAPLPVLYRGEPDFATGRDRGVVVEPSLIPAVPTLEKVTPPASQPALQLGETVVLSGHHLAGSARELRLHNERLGIDELVPALAGNQPDEVRVELPIARAADFPVGVYEVSVRVVPDGETLPRETNRLGLVLAPAPLGLPITVARVGGTASFGLSFNPVLRPGQQVSLLLGQLEVLPEDFVAPTSALNFVIPDAPAANHLARLRIDGIESPIIDRVARPPVFLDRRINIT